LHLRPTQTLRQPAYTGAGYSLLQSRRRNTGHGTQGIRNFLREYAQRGGGSHLVGVVVALQTLEFVRFIGQLVEATKHAINPDLQSYNLSQRPRARRVALALTLPGQVWFGDCVRLCDSRY
jgi:hypothetical protein